MTAEEAPYDPSKAWVARTLKHERALTGCRLSPCGRFVVAGGTDALVHRWEVEREAKSSLAGHAGWISALAFRGEFLYTADLHGTVQAWRYADPEPRPLWTIRDAHREWLRALAASPDGELVATGGYDRAVRLWSAKDGTLVRELPFHRGYVMSLAFHPDAISLATGDKLGTVRHWDASTGALVREIDASRLHTRGEEFLADVGGVRVMGFDLEGDTLACGGMSEAKSNTFCPGYPTVLAFDWFTGRPKGQLVIKQDGFDGYMNDLRFLPDGTLACVGEGFTRGAVWFWKAAAGEPFHSIPGQAIYGVDLHPDGRRLAIAAFEARGQGGNGRPAKSREEYVGNAGSVRVVHLFEKPKPPVPARKGK